MIKLKHSIPLALLSLAGASSPACADPKYDFALHGYIRSGILANSDGNRADSVGLMPDGKWRLGNEEAAPGVAHRHPRAALRRVLRWRRSERFAAVARGRRGLAA